MLPSLSELFNPSYLLLLGIVILSVALLYLYFENKTREQNHKISSMLSLVSSLAEEMNANRANTTNSRQPPPVVFYPKKLTVSDDEDEDDDDDEDEEDEDDDEVETLNDEDVVSDVVSDDDDNSDSDNSDDINSDLYTDDTVHLIEIGDNSNIKILKLNTMNMNTSNQQTEFDIDNIDNIEEGSDDLSVLDNDDNDDDDDDDDDDDEEHEDKSDSNINTLANPIINLDLKSIDISNLESPTVEYKKLSVAKLRSIAQEKGLIDDASKLKKPELIELLEK